MFVYRFFLTLLCLHIYLCVSAQISNITAFDPAPIMEKRYPNVKGSPWLYDGWLNGEIWGDNEAKLKNVRLRYDEYAEEVVVLDEGKTMKLNPATLKGFLIYYPKDEVSGDTEPYLFKNGYPFIDNYTLYTFYRVIFEGKKASFLQKNKVELFENIPTYGLAVTETSFIRKKRYFIYKDGKLQEVKLNKKDILAAIDDKRLANYVNEKRIRVKNEEDVAELLQAYEKL